MIVEWKWQDEKQLGRYTNAQHQPHRCHTQNIENIIKCAVLIREGWNLNVCDDWGLVGLAPLTLDAKHPNYFKTFGS